MSQEQIPRYTGLIRAHGLAALGMVLYTVLLGLVTAFKMSWPEFLDQTPWLTWGRLRYAHTQGVFFGWLGNAFLLFLYYAVPRLTNRPLTSTSLGWVLFVVWNFCLVLPGWVLLHIGISQPLEWGEFPLEIDAVAILALLLTCAQFVLPFFRGGIADLYVSGWYILGGLVFTTLAYPVGNLIPEIEPGARGASFSGLWIHDAIGLFVTPLVLAIAYIVIPATTGRPIYSHFLSMIGFWLLFLVYPLNGTHHYVFSSLPMEAQKAGIIASVYLGVDVLLVVTNLLLSLKGSSGVVMKSTPVRFVWVGVIAYLIVALQGSLQALMPVNRFVHFTDWVIGHAHLALIGFASFTAIGGILHVWQRSPGLRYNPRAAEWCFWLLTVGMLVMVLDLAAAGLVQGQIWSSEGPWIESVQASRIFWLIRALSGIPILLGFVALGWAMVTGDAGEESGVTAVSVDSTSEGPRWLRSAYVVTGVAGVGLFALSFVVLAVWPNQVVSEEIAETRPSGMPHPTESEERGRRIYIREGCGNCHSQLVRKTEDDVRRFGVASEAWESERDLPQLWGTRRIGPDLARQHGKHTRDWHLAHLFDPRHVVPLSIMPRYPWLFDGSARKPTREGLDLVAYLDSLGRAAHLAGLTGPRPLPGMSPEEEMFCDCAIPRTRGPAPLFRTTMPASEQQRFARRGSEVFANHCAGCHGDRGRGDGPAAESLVPMPRDLSLATFSDRALSEVLWNGKAGTAMPGFHELGVRDLRALAVFVKSLTKKTKESDGGKDSEKAYRLFKANCINCHGSSPASLSPAATDFERVRPVREYAERVLEQGIPGTSMTAWKKKLTLAERQLLGWYVRTKYREE